MNTVTQKLAKNSTKCETLIGKLASKGIQSMHTQTNISNGNLLNCLKKVIASGEICRNSTNINKNVYSSIYSSYRLLSLFAALGLF